MATNTVNTNNSISPIVYGVGGVESRNLGKNGWKFFYYIEEARKAGYQRALKTRSPTKITEFRVRMGMTFKQVIVSMLNKDDWYESHSTRYLYRNRKGKVVTTEMDRC